MSDRLSRWLERLERIGIEIKTKRSLGAILGAALLWVVIESLKHRLLAAFNEWQDNHKGEAMGLLEKLSLWVANHPYVWLIVVVGAILIHAYVTSGERKTETTPAIPPPELPKFDGHFWRIVKGLSDSDAISFDQYEQAMKLLQGSFSKQPVTADFDLLAEVFVENMSHGLAQIVHVELSMIVENTTVIVETSDELDRYALAKTTTRREGFAGYIDITSAKREPLPDLRRLLMGSAPLGYRNKAEGWLLFHFASINPNDLAEKKAKFKLTLYDSNGGEHIITKSLDVTRPGTIVRSENWSRKG